MHMYNRNDVFKGKTVRGNLNVISWCRVYSINKIYVSILIYAFASIRLMQYSQHLLNTYIMISPQLSYIYHEYAII